jgi:hypothetical protein
VDESRDELRDLGDLQARVDEELPPPERRSKPRAEFKPPPIYLPEPHMMVSFFGLFQTIYEVHNPGVAPDGGKSRHPTEAPAVP